MRRIRGDDIGMVFQEPMTSLNPVYTIGDQISEPIRVHRGTGKRAALDAAIALLDKVGIPDPRRRAGQYPHELSGGMRQRATIAMALACDPVLLDRRRADHRARRDHPGADPRPDAEAAAGTGMGMLFVTHNLGVVAEIAHRVAVMYAGRVVEDGPVAEVFRNPRHPYTVGLLKSMPKLGDATRMKAAGEKLAAIPGMVPSLRAMPPGCAFAPRCPWAIDACRAAVPALEQVTCPAPQPLHPLAGGPPMTAPEPLGAPLLAVRDLAKSYPSRGATLRILENISFDIARGEVVGLVGESGSGKTTIGRAVLRLIEPTAGAVTFDGTELTTLSPAEMRRQRPRMQYIFQDPFASLSPRMTIGEILTEGLKIQGIGTRQERLDRARKALENVDLPPDAIDRYAHEFSGGQRQRIGIARALALAPEFIVADEPVSALDVSIQAQVINLLRELQQRLGLTMLFISHDLAVVEFICDRVIVLYLGRIMEIASSADLYARPQHPYTRALLSAIPSPDPAAKADRQILKGDIPSPANPPSGCVFRTRCPVALPACAAAVPPLREVAPGHFKACIRDDLGGELGRHLTAAIPDSFP